MKNKIIAIGAATAIIAGGIAAGIAVAQPPLSIWLDDGNEVKFAVEPYIVDGRTMVPAVDLCEALNWGATSDIEDDEISIYCGRYVIDFTSGETTAEVYNYYTDELDTVEFDTPVTYDGTNYMIPLRALCEAFDIDIEWDGANNRVIVKTVPDEMDMDYEEYSEAAVLEGLNVNDDEYEGFEDFDFSDPQYDDISQEEVVR